MECGEDLQNGVEENKRHMTIKCDEVVLQSRDREEQYHSDHTIRLSEEIKNDNMRDTLFFILCWVNSERM